VTVYREVELGVKYRHFECVYESGSFGRLRPKDSFHGSVSSFSGF
jgi:hypothetical protein